MSNIPFLKIISREKLKNVDKAIALLWFSSNNGEDGMTAQQICAAFETAGYGKQNSTVLRRTLSKDRRTVRGQNDTFIIKEKIRPELDSQFSKFTSTKPLLQSDAVIPNEIFVQSRDYIKKVVAQLNASYEYSLFDCCAVMCRRLLETLIIELYEGSSRSNEITDTDGNFFMFSRLLSVIEKDVKIGLSRNTKKALNDFKRLGDLSAHNRRFNATKNDIDRIRDGLRTSCQELLNI